MDLPLSASLDSLAEEVRSILLPRLLRERIGSSDYQRLCTNQDAVNESQHSYLPEDEQPEEQAPISDMRPVRPRESLRSIPSDRFASR